MTINRRRFLGVVGAVAVGGPAAGALAAEPSLPIVDTHQHLWDLGKFELAWLKSSAELNRDHVMRDYLEATRGLNVVKAVYMEVDLVPQQQLAEAEHLIDVCRRGDSPTCAAVISGMVETEAFRDYILRFKGSPYIKGVRRLLFRPETRGGRCLEKVFVQNVRLLGELGMRFDICIAAAELSDAAKLVDLCPGTQFILDHCGNADVKLFKTGVDETAKAAAERWRRDLDTVAARKNVVCKISGIVGSAPKDNWTADDLAPVVNHCLDAFGPDRVMFGGDWPVCTRVASFRQWVDALRTIVMGRPLEHRRKLFAGNAIRVYGLT